MYDFTCTIVDAQNPRLILIEDASVELDIDLDWRSGEPAPIINDVYLYGERIPSQPADPFTAALRKRIVEMAEADLVWGDGQLWSQIESHLADQGLAYKGLPGDPDGRWGAIR